MLLFLNDLSTSWIIGLFAYCIYLCLDFKSSLNVLGSQSILKITTINLFPVWLSSPHLILGFLVTWYQSMLPNSFIPLCSAQWQRLFNSTRLPGMGQGKWTRRPWETISFSHLAMGDFCKMNLLYGVFCWVFWSISSVLHSMISGLTHNSLNPSVLTILWQLGAFCECCVNNFHHLQ